MFFLVLQPRCFLQAFHKLVPIVIFIVFSCEWKIAKLNWFVQVGRSYQLYFEIIHVKTNWQSQIINNQYHLSLLSKYSLILGLKALISYQNHIMIGQIHPKIVVHAKIDPQSLNLNFSCWVYSWRCRMRRQLSQLLNVNLQYFLGCYDYILVLFVLINYQYSIIQLQKQIISMNPFERLRKKIDNINVEYTFQAQHPNTYTSTNANFGNKTVKQLGTINEEDVEKLKQVCQNQQLNHIIKINEQAARLQQLQKALKRSQSVIENQVKEIVSLQKQNQLLKSNLNQHYNVVVQSDEKERKYKEEIYRINVTVNQLAIQINAERNNKKALHKQIDSLKDKINKQSNQIQCLKDTSQKENIKLLSQLEERKEMFEYNVKKNSEERKENKLAQIKLQENYEHQLNGLRIIIENLKQELLQTKKTLEIQSIYKKNIQQSLKKQRVQHSIAKDLCQNFKQDITKIKQKYDTAIKNREQLERNMNSLGSQLAEQRKNIKVKIIEVRDETLLLELEMYKKQCRQLMQQRAIMKNLNSVYQGTLESSYRIVKHQSCDNI